MSGMFSAVTDYFYRLFGSNSSPSPDKSNEIKTVTPADEVNNNSVTPAQAGGSKKNKHGKGSKKRKSNKNKSKKSKK